ncbi:MAG: hypothetical protein AAFR61_18425 [Bacteroidota bacterium]
MRLSPFHHPKEIASSDKSINRKPEILAWVATSLALVSLISFFVTGFSPGFMVLLGIPGVLAAWMGWQQLRTFGIVRGPRRHWGLVALVLGLLSIAVSLLLLLGLLGIFSP